MVVIGAGVIGVELVRGLFIQLMLPVDQETGCNHLAQMDLKLQMLICTLC